MPRQKAAVKNKVTQILTPGVVDLHFHGAFGIDLMSADPDELDQLSRQLAKRGVAAFCPTTLSAPPKELLQSVTQLGNWISRFGGRFKGPGAIPLGIHLEGPFVHRDACGAHPPTTIRPLEMTELNQLWEASRHTLKILTTAPELLSPEQLRELISWAKRRRIRLSLGHSHATESQAKRAFDAGFSGVTHAWNALHFHHRSPGPLGAAFGRSDVWVEIIPDLIHVGLTPVRWTLALHPNRVCFVSDCVPAAETQPGSWHPFGSLEIQFAHGACRLSNGALAGGGTLLVESFRRWVDAEAEATGVPVGKIMKKYSKMIANVPLRALGISASILKRGPKLAWKLSDSRKILSVRVIRH